MKQGRVGGVEESAIETSGPVAGQEALEVGAGVVDISTPRVYHRVVKYR